jgi:hypothetical protein
VSSARRMVVTKSGVKAVVTCGILGSLEFALAV